VIMRRITGGNRKAQNLTMPWGGYKPRGR
jgi:hypothetical protein